MFTGFLFEMSWWALFVTYTIIQSITSSEMCSLHLTHPSAHTLGAVGSLPGEQLGVWCLAQGSHLSRGQFLPELRFEPTTSDYKSNSLSTRPRLPHNRARLLLHNRALVVRIVFTDIGFWKYSWAHLVMSMTESCRWVMPYRLRAQRPRASNKGLRPCPLRTEISPVSLNLLIMLCTVDYEICKAFAIWYWGTLFLKYSTIFYALFHWLWSLCWSLLLRDSTSLRHTFYS